MRFTVVAIAPIPDIPTARRNFDLDDLSEKDVGRVLFHRRKQATGHSEALTWDQLSIAGVSLVHYSLDYVDMGSHALGRLDEPQLIGKIFNSLANTGQLVSWEGRNLEQPLLHFRCMKHRIGFAPYWEALRQGQQVHIDLSALLDIAPGTGPDLDGLAQRFHYPGMLGHDADGVWQAHLAGDYEGVRRYSDLRALNTYLLALEVLSLRGDMTHADAARARMKLRDYLAQEAPSRSHFQDFIDAWSYR